MEIREEQIKKLKNIVERLDKLEEIIKDDDLMGIYVTTSILRCLAQNNELTKEDKKRVKESFELIIRSLDNFKSIQERAMKNYIENKGR